MVDLDLTLNGTRYTCTPVTDATPDAWAFPVGEQGYPPERWYVAMFHGPSDAYQSGFHTGIDINLDLYERGDVERRLGLSVYAVASGVIEYVTQSWSGVPMLVMRTEHDGAPLWIRYAHIIPAVKTGDAVQAGDKLGAFADWATGDHLHFDMALDAYDREWCTPSIRWLDPVGVLKAHLDPARVDAMLEKG